MAIAPEPPIRESLSKSAFHFIFRFCMRLSTLSRCRFAVADICSEYSYYAAAVTTCHFVIASARNWRSVRREIRWRWTLKMS